MTISDDSCSGDGIFSVDTGVAATIADLTISGTPGILGPCLSVGITNLGGTLTVDDVIVQGYGIGIVSAIGTLTVTDSLVQGNIVRGIYSLYGATLVVRNTTVHANGQITPIGPFGPVIIGPLGPTSGGIDADGAVLISDSTITENVGGPGAGVRLANGVATISGTTIAGNEASFGSGGGIYVSATRLQLINSTVSGNTTSGVGGGLYVDSTGDATLRFVTLAANSAGIDGGGIFGGSIELLGTIVAGNVDNETASQTKHDCYGDPLVSLGSNLLGTGSDCPVGGAGDVAFSGDIATVLDPALADNGGPTPTHALVANSPALGVAADAACASSSGANGRDQRGIARPQGIRCDIGAFESDLPPACASPFGDVAQTDAACVAIIALADQGIIQGYTNGNFGPDDPVQRAQMAAFVVRAFQWQGLPVGPRTFTDFGELVGELRDASLILANLCADQSNDATCVARGYGDGRFGPNDQVSHAQVISFLARAFAQNENYGWASRPNGALPYTGVPGVHATDIRTYTFYAGAIPDAPTTQAGWDAPAPREWVALVLYQALQSSP